MQKEAVRVCRPIQTVQSLLAEERIVRQTIPKRKNRLYDTTRFEYPQIRVYHKAASGKRAPRYLLKCGDCEETVEVHYGEDGLEIGGVHGSIEDWREILLPLLLIEEKKGRLVKHKPARP